LQGRFRGERRQRGARRRLPIRLGRQDDYTRRLNLGRRRRGQRLVRRSRRFEDLERRQPCAIDGFRIVDDLLCEVPGVARFAGGEPRASGQDAELGASARAARHRGKELCDRLDVELAAQPLRMTPELFE
jgi:hypothetical protein